MNAKNSVKLLQRVGIALIALPDPISTPIGIAFIVAARFISKRLEVIFNKRLITTIRHYLSTSRPIVEITAEGNSKDNTTLKTEMIAVSPIIANHGNAKRPQAQMYRPAAKPAAPVSAAANNKITESAIEIEKRLPHLTDRNAIARRYGIRPKAGTEVSRGVQKNEDDALLGMKLDRQSPSKSYNAESGKSDSGPNVISGKVRHTGLNAKNETTDAGNVSEEKVNPPPRVMDAAALRRRYGISALWQRNHK